MKKNMLIICISVMLLLGCQKTADVPDDAIIARIGDRNITKNEFIRRSEYTIRPPYCKMGDQIIHKKIILNSLIAEKLLALEAEEKQLLQDHEGFQAFIKGRREQAMRKLLYNEKAYEKVKLSDREMADLFKVAGRTYHIQYFNVPDSATAAEIGQYLDEHPDQFAQVYEKYYGDDKVPARDVGLTDYENHQVEKALFTRPLKNGSVIKPLKITDNQYLMMRVDGWTDSRVFAEDDVKKRWEQVRERLTLRKASALWDDYRHNIMKGKHLKFSEDTFFKMAEIFATAYHFRDQEKQSLFNDRFWDRTKQSFDLDKISAALGQQEALQTAPFFTIDGSMFTVRDFRQMMASHPLVFRERRFSRSEFPQQFKLAVVDMIADQYLNQDAYDQGLDQHAWVRRTESMWRDALTGMYLRNTYLDSIGKKDAFIANYLPVLRNDLNPYVKSLQEKYSDRIEIDADLLKQIKLTRIDMFVIQKWEPYPVIVPQFPVITDEHRLDYGKDMP